MVKGKTEWANYMPSGVIDSIPGMMRKKNEKANISALAGMQKMAHFAGIELVVSILTFDMMEIDGSNKPVEGVRVWNTEDFLTYVKDCKICLFAACQRDCRWQEAAKRR